MIDFQCKEYYDVSDLREIITLLRGADGCPWDREQTHTSIRRNFLEETYEVCEAIDEGDPAHLKEELGDVLTQVLFHARIEEEEGRFDLDDVADATCKKLIFRHPHVFGGARVSGAEQVLTNWDALKRQEKRQTTTAAAMAAVARSLPATWRAEKIQGKAQKVGFDWPDVSGALDKLSEELGELRQAIAEGDGIAEEAGDLLFSAVNVARMLGLDPEQVLHDTSDKFTRRFAHMEQAATERGTPLDTLSLDEMEALYQQGKQRL